MNNYINRFQRDTNFPEFEKFDLNKPQPLHGEEVSKIRLAISEAWEECLKWQEHNGSALTLAEYLDKNHPIK